jgi:hypothetical protein
MAVCVELTTGAVTARAKCKLTEAPLNLATVAASAVGPQGPKGDAGSPGGINFSQCYTKTATSTATVGAVVSTAVCNDQTTEFMLSEGIDKTRASPVISEKTLVFDPSGTVPTGVSYFTGYVTTGTNPNYDVTVTLVCCKR